MRKAVKLSWLLIIIILLICNCTITAQSIMGYNGLFRIPIASKNTDKEVSSSLHFVDKSISVLESGVSNNLRASISINYLPFLEVNLILNNLINSNETGQAIGDRQSSFKIILTDLGMLPNIAFGVYDALGSLEKGGVHSDFSYLVCSRIIPFSKELDLEISAGYASPIYNDYNTGLKGFLAGICFKLFDQVEIFGEYDSKYYNTGARLRFFDHLILIGGFNQMKYFSGGIGYYFNLN